MKRSFCLFVVYGISLSVWMSYVAGTWASAADTETSPLWGRRGEQWRPGSRLPDFSYAGYHRGEAQIPTRDPDGRWFERIPPDQLRPESLYDAQLKKSAGTGGLSLKIASKEGHCDCAN